MLYSLYDQFVKAFVGEQLFLKEEIDELFHSIEEPSIEDLHILGLIHLKLASNENDIKKALNFFQKAKEIKNTYVIPRLYTAHCYFDLKKLDLALKEYLLVDQEKLKELFSLWRFVKFKEKLGYCYFKTGQTEEALHSFEEVVTYYRNSDLSDLVNPQEIYECLDENHDLVKELREIEKKYF